MLERVLGPIVSTCSSGSVIYKFWHDVRFGFGRCVLSLFARLAGPVRTASAAPNAPTVHAAARTSFDRDSFLDGSSFSGRDEGTREIYREDAS